MSYLQHRTFLILILIPESPEPPAHIKDFELELQCKILSYLDPTTSTCLGLTCRRLYQAYSNIHFQVSLNSGLRAPVPHYLRKVKLYMLLKSFMSPLVFEEDLNKFVTWERHKALVCDVMENDWKLRKEQKEEEELLAQQAVSKFVQNYSCRLSTLRISVLLPISSSRRQNYKLTSEIM